MANIALNFTRGYTAFHPDFVGFAAHRSIYHEDW